MPGFIERHKKAVGLFILFVFLFWLVTIQVKNGRLPFLERPVLAVSGFFERTITGAYTAVTSVGKGYVALVRTERENRRLRDEASRLRLENQMANELLAENERLRELLLFKKNAGFSTIAVRVIGKRVSPASTTVTINAGYDDGVAPDAAVVTADGIVGKVQTVLAHTAKVILITDPESTLAVRVQRNREEGLLEGKITSCALKYVSYYADIQEGDLLVTSGLDGIYPKGMPVARVTTVKRQEAVAFQSVSAAPIVALSRLEEALVLKK